jgi:Sec-independent protein translocase protein TatA
MGDMGSGITAFKKGLKEEEKKAQDGDDEDAKAIDDTSTVTRTEEKDKAVSG